ncbi:hypothetical protein IFT71_20300 [Sphingomonas sp. CFBP 13733]|nr:hypothetical protein [Sphingomonas sp. CFBP 13733]
MAAHLGLADSELSSALDTISAMKAGMAEDDPRVFLERIELGDAYARAGRFIGSEKQYAGIARRAHKLGLIEIEGLALLRVATLKTRLAEQNYTVFGFAARRAIDALIARREPALQPYQVAGRQLSFLLAAQTTPGPELDRLIERYPRQPAGAPALLLYAPAVALTASSRGSGNRFAPNSNPAAMFNTEMPPVAMGSYVGQWIDVAFAIGTDGRISDAHISRHGDHVALKGGGGRAGGLFCIGSSLCPASAAKLWTRTLYLHREHGCGDGVAPDGPRSNPALGSRGSWPRDNCINDGAQSQAGVLKSYCSSSNDFFRNAAPLKHPVS